MMCEPGSSYPGLPVAAGIIQSKNNLMKRCTQIVLVLLCMLASNSTMAQKKSSARPPLFKEFPLVINCTEEQLASLFTYDNGTEVTLLLPDGLTLKGPVRWWAKKYSNLQTVSIKLTEFNNTLFSVSRRFDANNNFIYVAHLFNPDYADGYELKRKEGGKYQLVKMDTEKIIQICSR